MRRRDFKKKRTNNEYNRKRPAGFPAELITLINGDIVGGYGVRNNNEQWEILVDDGWTGIKDKKLSWITSKQIKKIEAWTPKRQAALEQKYQQQKAKARDEQATDYKEEISNQSKLAFASEQMIHIINAGGQTFKLLSDFKGNLLNTKSKHKTAQEYLTQLISVYGHENVNCQSMLR